MRHGKGIALIFSLVITTLIILTALSLAIVGGSDLVLANKTANSVRAYYMAEAGLAKKFMELRDGNTSNIFNETFTITTGRSGTFSVTVTLLTAAPFAIYQLDSTGTYGNSTRTVSMTVRQTSIARFAYLSNSESRLFWWWSRPIWFITGDMITGPMHTNNQLNISGDPIFDGPVSSVATTINYYHGGPPDDDPDFRESLTLGAPAIAFPTTTNMINPIRTAAQASGGLYLTGNTNITLLADGTMNVTNSAKNWTNHNEPMPINQALFVDNGDVNISGILNGQLTVGTNRDIVVMNNLLYNDDPRVNPSSTDMLGLVSQNNVIIDSTAPFDVEVDGYIVALNTSFTVENYNVGLKGTLSLLGGLTQVNRGAVGTFNPTTNERVSGYTKDYQYDDRLESQAPSYFPAARDSDNKIIYVKVSWAEY